MSKNNIDHDENDYQYIMMCIRQKCLICREEDPDEGMYGCTDFGCPLWLYNTAPIMEYDDFCFREKHYIKQCEQLNKQLNERLEERLDEQLK